MDFKLIIILYKAGDIFARLNTCNANSTGMGDAFPKWNTCNVNSTGMGDVFPKLIHVISIQVEWVMCFQS